MACSTFDDGVTEVSPETERLQQEVTSLAADSAPGPGIEGLKEGMQQNVILQSQLAGMILTAPMGNIEELSSANKENRTTAKQQLDTASSEACRLQRQVLLACQSVDGKFTEMLQKMSEMSKRIERLQSQKAALEKLEEAKTSHATFRLGDEEHRSSTASQQLEQVEKKLELVQRTHKACESAVRDLVAWKEELTTKTQRITDGMEEELKQRKPLQATLKESKRSTAKFAKSLQDIEELSGVTVVHQDQSQLVLRVMPFVESGADAAGSTSVAEEPVELVVRFSGACEQGEPTTYTGVELVSASGHPIPIEEDLSQILGPHDLRLIVNWAREHFRKHTQSKPS